MLPEYPATLHLPWKPNTNGDRIASNSEARIIFESPHVTVSEKVDGANCGMCLFDGNPIIRSRTKFIGKGRVTGKANPSLAQFSSVYSWFYKNKDKFEALNADLGDVSVYGEWMVQQHGMVYNYLPDWFIAFDVYDWGIGRYIDPKTATKALLDAGFVVPPMFPVEPGKLTKYEQLEELVNGVTSPFSGHEKPEGLYVKVSDGKYVTGRFKMVREGFRQGSLLGEEIRRNKVTK